MGLRVAQRREAYGMGGKAMTVALDLRLCPRVEVRGWSAWIQWWDRGYIVGVSAELVNISLGGALMIAPTLPPGGWGVTLHIEVLEPQTRLSAVVVDTQSGPRGHRVNFEFTRPCPVAVLEAVVGDLLWVP